MDLTLSPSEAAFRDELRAWLADNHPGEDPPGRRRSLRAPARVAAQALRGRLRRLLLAEGVRRPRRHARRAGALRRGDGARQGALAGERARHGDGRARGHRPRHRRAEGALPRPILTGDEIWCQGFSEPESGSDLASLKTKAVKSNGEWVVTGQKVWTTYAHKAKWCMLVARTDQDVPKHQGLTYFIMDMEQDAVQVRPLHQITGEPEFNELFIEEARIPDENVVGGVGNGWAVAITTLMNERAGLGAAAAAGVRIALERAQGARPRARRRRGPDHPPAARPAGDRGRAAAPELLARPDPDHEARRARPRGLAAEVAVGRDQPGAHRARRGHPRRGGRLLGLSLDLPPAALARELDRGRHDRDPQEHHRRARARPAQAAGERR